MLPRELTVGAFLTLLAAVAALRLVEVRVSRAHQRRMIAAAPRASATSISA